MSRIYRDIESWRLTLKNGVTPQKQQSRLGTARVVIGKCDVMLDLNGYLTQDDGYQACVDNPPLRFGAGLRNADGGVFLDVPSLTFNDGRSTSRRTAR